MWPKILVAMMVVPKDQGLFPALPVLSQPCLQGWQPSAVTTGGQPDLNLWVPLRAGIRGIHK